MPHLHAAISDRNEDQLRWLLRHGANVTEPDADGNTPLMLAMKHQCYEADIRRILRRGADLLATNKAGHNALAMALDYSFVEGVEELLKHYMRRRIRPTADFQLDNGRLALLFGVVTGNAELARQSVEAGANPDTPNATGETPLILATRIGNSDMVRLLLNLGAQVDCREVQANAWTALHFAADEGHAECAEALLAHGAEVNARDKSGRTPLMWVAFRSSAPTTRLLIDHGADVLAKADDGPTALLQAAWLADEDVIRILLEHGAGEDAEELRRAFHACFTDNNLDKAPLLIEAGAKVGLAEAILLKDNALIQQLLSATTDQAELNRALCAAAVRGGADLVGAVLEHGAKVNCECRYGGPLNEALRNLWESDPVFDVLLDAGANVNSRDQNGQTAFAGQCIGPPDLELLRRMLALGADVNAADSGGWTPLIRTSWLKEYKAVRFLLACGADVHIADEEGRTALILAAEAGSARVARLLLKFGARPDAPDRNGRTARSIAERWVGRPIARVLAAQP